MPSISPIPQKSPLCSKESIIELDWLRWLRDVTTYVTRILNKYDNEKSGIVSLTLGTASVSVSSIRLGNNVRLTRQAAAGTLGHLSVVVTPSVGLTITSDNPLDTSTIFYEIVEAF